MALLGTNQFYLLDHYFFSLMSHRLMNLISLLANSDWKHAEVNNILPLPFGFHNSLLKGEKTTYLTETNGRVVVGGSTLGWIGQVNTSNTNFSNCLVQNESNSPPLGHTPCKVSGDREIVIPSCDVRIFKYFICKTDLLLGGGRRGGYFRGDCFRAGHLRMPVSISWVTVIFCGITRFVCFYLNLLLIVTHWIELSLNLEPMIGVETECSHHQDVTFFPLK